MLSGVVPLPPCGFVGCRHAATAVALALTLTASLIFPPHATPIRSLCRSRPTRERWY